MRPSTRKILKILCEAERPLTMKDLDERAEGISYRTVRYAMHMLGKKNLTKWCVNMRDIRSRLYSPSEGAQEVLNK